MTNRSMIDGILVEIKNTFNYCFILAPLAIVCTSTRWFWFAATGNGIWINVKTKTLSQYLQSKILLSTINFETQFCVKWIVANKFLLYYNE